MNEDEKAWSGAFREALVILLAIEIAYNVTDDKPRIQLLEQKFSQIIKSAIESGEIKSESGLPKQREGRRSYGREVPYMDYSGIPTLLCSPLNYCGGLYHA